MIIRATGYLNPPTGDHQKKWEIDKLFKARNITGKPKGSANLLDLIPNMLDQRSLGACTLHGWAQQVRADSLADDTKTVPDLMSILFAYYNTRLIADSTTIGQDTGADPHTVGKAVNKYGLPKEKYWRYDIGKFARRPSDTAYSRAYKNRGPWEWYWISRSDPDAITKVQLALDARSLVGIGTGIDWRYGDWKPGDDPLEPPTEPEGMHYTVMVGYDKDGVLDLGSWGTGYADGGVWKRSYNYIKYKYTTSMLVITRAPVI